MIFASRFATALVGDRGYYRGEAFGFDCEGYSTTEGTLPTKFRREENKVKSLVDLTAGQSSFPGETGSINCAHTRRQQFDSWT